MAGILHILKCCGKISFKSNRVSPSCTVNCDDGREKAQKNQMLVSGILLYSVLIAMSMSHKHARTHVHTETDRQTDRQTDIDIMHYTLQVRQCIQSHFDELAENYFQLEVWWDQINYHQYYTNPQVDIMYCSSQYIGEHGRNSGCMTTFI